MKYFFYTLSIFLVTFIAFGFLYYNGILAKASDNFSARMAGDLQLASVASIKLPVPPEERVSTLLFVGDMMLSRGVGNKMAKYNDYVYPFRQTADFLRSADLTIGNLEGPISDRGEDTKKLYSFRDDPRAMEGLKLAGFDILDVNNNHIMDWGEEALKDTLTRITDNGINYVGAGFNYDEANAPVIKNINGTKIAFLAFNDLSLEYSQSIGSRPGLSDFDLSKITDHIKNIKETKQADIVVVMLHWGQEYQTESNRRQKDIAHRLVDSGADLVIGHHPHVVQETEQYGGGQIVYSLGNFVFDQHDASTTEGLVVRVTIKDGKIRPIEPIAIKISPDFQPFIPSL